MKLLLDRLKATPSRYDFAASPAWWGEQVDACDLGDVVDPFLFEVDAYMLGEDVFLGGTWSGAIEVECSRCLRRYRHALAEPFRLLLEPAGKRVPADPEEAKALGRDGLCLGDDLEVGRFRGPEIVLDTFFTELISLALPVQPLCDDDCKGLCPRCGVDRNRVDCGCEEEIRPPSPFAVLAALKGKGGDDTRN